MTKEQMLPLILVPLFLILFALFWLLIMKMIAMMGWEKFSRRQTSDARLPDGAKRYGMQSLFIGQNGRRSAASYKGGMNIYIDRSGLFMRPIWLVRWFHPLLHFRWQEIKSISLETDKLVLGFKVQTYIIDVGHGQPSLTVTQPAGRKIYEAWCQNTGRPVQPE